MSAAERLAENIFWKMPELVESLLLHLDDYSILCLAQAKSISISITITNTNITKLHFAQADLEVLKDLNCKGGDG